MAPFEYVRGGTATGADDVDAAPAAASAVEALADRVVTEDGVVTLDGDATIDYLGRRLSAGNARYDTRSAEVDIDGPMSFGGDGLVLESEDAHFDLDDATFRTGASRYGLDVDGRRASGSASAMERDADGRLTLEGATYSTCPPADASWLISARRITLDQERGIGTARRLVLDFKGVPILAVPAFSFPIGPQRKSGFLAPAIGRSGNVGFEVQIPWYWNVRPNLDATFTPRLTSRRGPILQSELRYLNAQGGWLLESTYLRDRELDGRRRSFTHVEHTGHFDPYVTSRIEASEVSDGAYFQDLGGSLEAASITHLEQRAELVYERGALSALARLQSFQTVDERIVAADRPYRRLPQLAARAVTPIPLGLVAETSGEFVYFDRDDSVTGSRIDVQPRLSLPLSGDAWFVRPSVAQRFTYYSLDDADAGSESVRSRNVGTFAVDTGLFFDRVAGDGGTVQTLEPRLYYLHVPYVEQSRIPVFDSAAFDFSISQLYRENRFSGADRVADAEQLSFGLTTRFIDGADGSERLRASVGQILYLADRRVVLERDGETVDDAIVENRRGTSDLVGEISTGFARDWLARGSIQWNPDTDRTARSSLALSYRPPDGRLLNVAHRLVDLPGRPGTEQIDLSGLWPIGDAWRVAGRWNYSLDENIGIESLIGLEYDSCCWALRFAARRYVSDDELGHENSVYLQLVLKGLAPLGQNYGALLKSTVLGYRERAE